MSDGLAAVTATPGRASPPASTTRPAMAPVALAPPPCVAADDAPAKKAARASAAADRQADARKGTRNDKDTGVLREMKRPGMAAGLSQKHGRPESICLPGR